MSEVFFWVLMCVRIATLSAWEMALDGGGALLQRHGS